MGLVFDNPDVKGPASHAFIAGVSAYPFAHKPGEVSAFGIEPLSFAARSAHRLYEWLLGARLAQPLASVRMLLSPGEGETFAQKAEECTLANFMRDASEWRRAAASHRDNLTIFYFAGRGFAPTQGEQLLVLQNFGDMIGPLLRNAVSVNNIVYGMAPGAAGDVARTQLYFIDSGRTRPAALAQYQAMNSSAVFDAPLRGIDDRTAPVYYASSMETPAFGVPNEVTLFCRALIEGLSGAAARVLDDGRWAVTAISLADYIGLRVSELAAEEAASQSVGVEGSLGPAVITYVDGPPDVPVKVTFAARQAILSVAVKIQGDEGPVGEWRTTGDSLDLKLPAGLYQVAVVAVLVSGESLTKVKFTEARAPRSNWKVALE
jgi:hypothetical protein